MLSKNRIILNQEAKMHMKKGEWRSALDILVKARALYGDNVMLLVDQATCEWMLGSLHSLKTTVETLEASLMEYASILSTNSVYNARLFLGKYVEEQGQLKRAIGLYRSILDEAMFDDRQKIMAEAQLLRVQSFLGLASEVEESFIDLSLRLKNHQTENQKVEVLHALMLADVELIGVEAALARYDRAVAVNHSESDTALLYFDLAEAHLLEGRALEIEKAPEANDEFERTLEKIQAKTPLLYRDVIANLDQLTFTTQFRTAYLVTRFGTENVDQARATKLVSILLRSFDAMSAKALTTKLLISEGAFITIDQRDVIIGEHRLSWTRKSTALSVLIALSQRPQMSTEDLIRDVWQAEASPSYNERLRVLVHRINSDLQTVAMNPQVIVLANGKASLADGLKIQRA